MNALIEAKLDEWSFYRPLDGKTVQVRNFRVSVTSEDFILSEEHGEKKC
jgi:hypothetical protein